MTIDSPTARRTQQAGVRQQAPGDAVASTLCEMFRATVLAGGDRPALRGPDSEISWRDYGRRVERLAGRLAAIGLLEGDRAALMTRNTPDFHVVDTALMCAAAVPFSISAADPVDRLVELIDLANAKVLFVEAEFLDLARALVQRSMWLTAIVVIGDSPGPEMALGQLEAAPAGAPVAAMVTADSIATLIFTSGTTGTPKAVQLSHRAVVSSLISTNANAPVGRDGRLVSYLPLNHIAERFMSHYLSLGFGGSVTCVPDPDALYDTIRQVRPTRFFGVPRVYEKLAAAARRRIDADPALQVKLEQGIAAVQAEQASGGTNDELQAVLESTRAALRSIVSATGLEDSEYCGVATAPASRAMLEFLSAIGLPVSNIWGMSEAIMCTMNPPGRLKLDTVGVFLDGVQGRIDSTGEILIRGRNVMSGYLFDPVRTAQIIDADGWVHTGDLGAIDADGYLSIIGRQKEMLITATGRNIVPSVIEGRIKEASRLIDQVVLVADGRRYVTALIAPDLQQIRDFAPHLDAGAPAAELVRDPVVLAEVGRAVEAGNMAGPRAESVRAWRLLAAEWLPGGDEMTLTMKLRRTEIAAKYAAEMDCLYD